MTMDIIREKKECEQLNEFRNASAHYECMFIKVAAISSNGCQPKANQFLSKHLLLKYAITMFELSWELERKRVIVSD